MGLTSLLIIGASLAALLGGHAFAQGLPPPPAGATLQDAQPRQWPETVKAPAGAPNVLIIMTDDVGFESSSTFGGPVPTPAFEALAREGLRYNRFHTTAICSPTRASLLTGRNPHDVNVGYVCNWSSGFEDYTSMIPKSAGTLPQILRANGYSTAMFGKLHVTPEWELGPNGPFDRWTTGLGLDYYYGFLGADTSAFEPSLVENTRPVTVPTGPAYHLEKDLADRAIAWINEQRATSPERPFFAYLAPGAAHAPNHAPDEWLAKFRGRFDEGWDVLRAQIVARQKALGVIPKSTSDAPGPKTLPRWDSLTPERRRVYARYMEAFAASLAYADAQIGRVIDELRRTGEIDNTLVIYIQGDNGASAESSYHGKFFEQSALSGVVEDLAWAQARIEEIGTKSAYNLNPGGWGWAMNAPFPWAKRYGSHLGGTRNGMVIRWKGQIQDEGALRSQFLHVSDIMPTVLEGAGIAPPSELGGILQQPITGVSAAYTFGDALEPSRRTRQVFAMAENLALYHDGWVAATVPKSRPWEPAPPAPVALADRRWQLYNLERDFSEAHDLADRHPERLARMVEEFWKESQAGRILPIHTSEGQQAGRPDSNQERTRFTYVHTMTQLAESSVPDTIGHSFAIDATVSVPASASGVVVAHGGRFGGYSLFLKDGRLHFAFNLTPAHMARIAAPDAIAAGRHGIGLHFKLDTERPSSAATVSLIIDGKTVSSGRVPQTIARVVSHSEGFDVGQDIVSPVDPESYSSEKSAFPGMIERLDFIVQD